jgi:O-methyltransferase
VKERLDGPVFRQTAGLNANILKPARRTITRSAKVLTQAGLWLRFLRIHAKYRDSTVLNRSTYVINLLLAQRYALNVSGCVVECGVWRGGMTAGLADVLGPDREYFLFDSFEGLPPVQDIDGQAAKNWQADTANPGYHDNCTASEEEARRAMSLSAAAHFTLIKGWFEKTLPDFKPPSPIALLRLDADWYESTRLCLDRLYHYVTDGGLVIIDDYGYWDGCARAVHEFLCNQSENGSGKVPRLRQFYNRVYYFVR